ncbi:U32 family peptidase [bacterium]|nr:U32 family peptidase [bacterium]
MDKKLFKPEILAPAGTFEKGKTAFLYGADAIYAAGPYWSLRQGAGNFSMNELETIIKYAHQNSKKVYVTVNSYFTSSDLKELPIYLKDLNSLNVDGVIFSDPSLYLIYEKLGLNFDLHLSTQSSLLNIEAAKFWKDRGVTRVVPGRELSIEEAGEIKKTVDIEVEMFIHGAMCVSYSGKCLLSNFMVNRDSNRGGCAQSCRWRYKVYDENGDVLNDGYPLNSKDLTGINLIDSYFEHQIDSLKIEGRMKSLFYIARIVSFYKKAIDSFPNKIDTSTLHYLSNREFTEGFLGGDIKDSIRFDSTKYNSIDLFLGVVIAKDNNRFLLSVKYGFNSFDPLYILLPDSNEIKIESIFFDSYGNTLTRINPNHVVFFESKIEIPHYSLMFLRKNSGD